MPCREKNPTSLPHIKLSPFASLAAAVTTTIAARRLRALSPGGAVAATAVGGAVLTGAGLRGAAATMTFFVSSTLLGRLHRSPGRQQRRGNERDTVQVFANGGVAAGLALAALNDSKRRLLLAGFAGALAAATADTWATEIGSRASQRPRSIISWRPVPAGTSGGVSWVGLLASASGALSIGAVMSIGLSPRRWEDRPPMRAIALGGFCGALADSVLGATVQELRFCLVCGEETEAPRHQCGMPTITVRGIPGFSNDVVNFVATLIGATVATLLAGGSPIHFATDCVRPEPMRAPGDQCPDSENPERFSPLPARRERRLGVRVVRMRQPSPGFR
jgi:uncharacterized protein (TIGR00297 family)